MLICLQNIQVNSNLRLIPIARCCENIISYYSIIALSSTSTRIAVLFLSLGYYCRNSTRVYGGLRYELKHIQKLGYEVVTVGFYDFLT